MQKLELKRIYKFCKSGSYCHTEHSKIGFTIFGFFYDFILILQGSARTLKRVKNHFAKRPLESFEGSQICPRFAHRPQERTLTKQLGPQAWGWRRNRNFGEVLAGEGRGRGGEGSRDR
jgi:hypothetical protein